MACYGSFPSSHGEKHHNPKSGQEVDSDKLGYAISCHGPTQNFCTFFLWILVPDAQLFKPTLDL